MKIRLSSILKWVASLSLGKELGLAVTLLSLIASSFGKFPTEELGRIVYMQLPVRFKEPLGTVSEAEFTRLIMCGIDFYRALRTALTR